MNRACVVELLAVAAALTVGACSNALAEEYVEALGEEHIQVKCDPDTGEQYIVVNLAIPEVVGRGHVYAAYLCMEIGARRVLDGENGNEEGVDEPIRFCAAAGDEDGEPIDLGEVSEYTLLPDALTTIRLDILEHIEYYLNNEIMRATLLVRGCDLREEEYALIGLDSCTGWLEYRYSETLGRNRE